MGNPWSDSSRHKSIFILDIWCYSKCIWFIVIQRCLFSFYLGSVLFSVMASLCHDADVVLCFKVLVFFTHLEAKLFKALFDGVSVVIMSGDVMKQHCLYYLKSTPSTAFNNLSLEIFAKEESQDAVASAAAKSLQSCPTLCDPIDGSPPGSTIPGIFQARTLEWVAISFSNAWRWKEKVKLLSRVWLLATP